MSNEKRRLERAAEKTRRATAAAAKAAVSAEIDNTIETMARLRGEQERGRMLDAMTEEQRHMFLAAERAS